MIIKNQLKIPFLNRRGVHQKIIDKEGRIITNSPDLTYIPKYESNGVPRYNPVSINNTDHDSPQNPLSREPSQVSKDISVLDTAWLGGPAKDAASSRPGLVRRRHGLLMGRSAVSYQNLSPVGQIFASPKLASVDENCTATQGESSLACSSFSSDGAATTNVAWLVGTGRTTVLLVFFLPSQ